MATLVRFSGENFNLWKVQTNLYLSANKLSALTVGGNINHDAVNERNKQRVHTILTAVEGPVLQTLINASHGKILDKSEDELWNLLESIYDPKASKFAERNTFYQYRKPPNIGYIAALREVRKLASTCDFSSDHDPTDAASIEKARILDQGIIMLDQGLREKVLTEPQLTLEKLEAILQRADQQALDRTIFAENEAGSAMVHKVRAYPDKYSKRGDGKQHRQRRDDKHNGGGNRCCKICGYTNHTHEQCWHKENPCRRCGENCRFKKKTKSNDRYKQAKSRYRNKKTRTNELAEAETSSEESESESEDDARTESLRVGTLDAKQSAYPKKERESQRYQAATVHERQRISKNAKDFSQTSKTRLSQLATKDVRSSREAGTQMPLKPKKGSRKSDTSSRSSRPPSSPTEESETKLEDTTLCEVRRKIPRWKVPVKVNGHPLVFTFDSGSDLSVCDRGTWESLGRPKLTATKCRAKAFNGSQIKFLGMFDAAVELEGRFGPESKSVPLFVADLDRCTTTMGMDWPLRFKLNWPLFIAHVEGDSRSTSAKLSLHAISSSTHLVEPLLRKYRQLFEPTLGRLKNVECKLHFKEGARPKLCRPRPLPFALMEPVEKELKRLLDEGVIVPADQLNMPVRCTTPIVPIRKPNGNVRICGDFKVSLNPYIEADTYPLPLISDLLAKLQGGQRFSKIDLKDAFLQIEVASESQPYLVITTHKGEFAYKRMPFGISVAPSIQQRAMDQICAGLEGVTLFVDDICVTGRDDAEHLRNLEALFKRCVECGVKLSLPKCDFFKDEIEYLGNIITAKGHRPDPKKIAAVIDAPIPENLTQLRSFLGMVNVYRKFLPALAEKAAPLYALEKKDVKYRWTRDCQKAFDQIKRDLTAAPILVHYDQKLPLGLVTDASQQGISAVLFHITSEGEKPIAYWSRTLSAAEKNWPNIEREGLAIYWGVLMSHQYVYGRRFKLYTDHSPLTTIFGEHKNLPRTSTNRLQRWAIVLSGYDYEIHYRKGVTVAEADCWSRLPIPMNIKRERLLDQNFELQAVDWDVQPVNATEIAKATLSDPILSTVLRHVQRGWPDHVQDQLMEFFKRRNELTADQGCILWGTRVVIPSKLRARILNELHEGHPGIVRMKGLARQYVWWPGINQDIADAIGRCVFCQDNQEPPKAAPIHPWELPQKPWQRIHIDFAGEFHGKHFLIVVCARTKWPEVVTCKDQKTSTVIEALEALFCRWGLPDQIVSDNGPCFASEEMAQFTKRLNIRHSFSSAWHPRTNGQAECVVKTFKRKIGTATIDSKELERRKRAFLLSYRNTPHPTTGVSPAELFLGRRLQMSLDRIYPKIEDSVARAQQKLRESVKTKLREFQPGDRVRIRRFPDSKETHWDKGVVCQRKANMTYLVRLNTGPFLKRHIDHLLPLPLKPQREESRQAPCQPPKSQPRTLWATIQERENIQPTPQTTYTYARQEIEQTPYHVPWQSPIRKNAEGSTTFGVAVGQAPYNEQQSPNAPAIEAPDALADHDYTTRGEERPARDRKKTKRLIEFM